MKTCTDLGLHLRNLRVNLGLTQKFVADQLERSTTYVSDVENCTAAVPKGLILRKWLAVLQCEERFEEFQQLALHNRTFVNFKLRPKDPANHAMVRLAERYIHNQLTEFDRALLSCID